MTNAELIRRLNTNQLLDWLDDIGACMKKPRPNRRCGDKSHCRACWTSWLAGKVNKTTELEKTLEDIIVILDHISADDDDISDMTLEGIDHIKRMAKEVLKAD